MSENIIMPKLGMTMKEGTVEEWFKSEGDTVKQGESIVTISSEKLTNDVEAPASGTLLEIKVQAGEDAEVKAVLGVIGEEGEAIDKDEDDLASEKVKEDNEHEKETQEVKDTSQQSSDNEDNSPKSASRERIFISPLARNMAEDKGLDINKIKGTGGNHRITKLDIQRVEANGYDYASDTTSNEDTSRVPTQTVDTSAIGEGLNPMRQRIAQNMRQSLNNTAQLTLHRKVDADRLLDFKDRLATELKQADQDVKLTVTLGIATSLDEGLMVPVINHADTKSIGTLAHEIKSSAEAIREGNTGAVQLEGATFTITNMGASGIEYFTPILNLGETGILGVGALTKEVVLEADNIKQVSKIPLSLTFDHQILDGAGAADFLKVLAKYIENPYLLML
ncbi:MAG: dihydrolipoamide acetyltransferase family protein [Staphylococcus epidermidis]|nr:dihydrolipoamide acetyltransferase family protein [Staphylococcus epidermidis]